MSNANEEELYSIRTMSSSCPSQAINMPPKCTSSDRPISFVPSPPNQHELLLTISSTGSHQARASAAPSTSAHFPSSAVSSSRIQTTSISCATGTPKTWGTRLCTWLLNWGWLILRYASTPLKTSRIILAVCPIKLYPPLPHGFATQPLPNPLAECSPPPTKVRACSVSLTGVGLPPPPRP